MVPPSILPVRRAWVSAPSVGLEGGAFLGPFKGSRGVSPGVGTWNILDSLSCLRETG